MKLSIDFDKRTAKKFFDDVHNIAVEKAIPSSLNRAAAKTRTKAKRRISKTTGVQQKQINDLLKIYKASRTKQTASLYVRAKTPNAIRFGAKETKKHLSVRAFRKTQRIKQGFIGNKGRTAFKRKGDSRTPIRPVYGPNVARAFSDGNNLRAYQRYAGLLVAKEFKSAFDYHMSRIR